MASDDVVAKLTGGVVDLVDPSRVRSYGTAGTVGMETKQASIEFVILDVAWGDPGGWTVR